jgi:hypothetical protein
MTVRPSLFVGSSSEGLEFARAVRGQLDGAAEITVWSEGAFEVGRTFIEDLSRAASRFDFAVLVLTPDDFLESRTKGEFGPRDNVIFELGLFMGAIGRDRTFILQQNCTDLKIPSDLSGVTTAQFSWPRTDGNRKAAVATACDAIREKVQTLGVRSRSEEGEVAGLDLNRVSQRNGEMWTTLEGCEIRVVNGHLEDQPAEPTRVVVLPCNEYFDDRCAYDTKSALGAYANKVFQGKVDAFVSCAKEEWLS